MSNMPYKIKKTKIAALPQIALLILSTLSLYGCGGPENTIREKPVYPPAGDDEARFIYERTIRSTADIRTPTFADKLKLFATGTGEDAFGLVKPYGIDVRKGKIYVADTVQRSVLLFDIPNSTYRHIGGDDGPGALSKPIDLDIGPNDELYVVDNSAAKVLVYTSDGDFIREISGAGHLVRPSGVAVSNDGSKVYVVNTGGVRSSEHGVHVFDNITGEHLAAIGTRGSDEGNFNLPLLADIAPDGTLYVVDGSNFRVQAFNADNSFKMKFGSIGIKTGQFSKPKGIATDKDGNIYVVDTNFGNFQIFSADGVLLLNIGHRADYDAPGAFLLPADVAVDEDGRVYVTDQFFKKIDIFRPANLKENEGYLGSITK